MAKRQRPLPVSLAHAKRPILYAIVFAGLLMAAAFVAVLDGDLSYGEFNLFAVGAAGLIVAGLAISYSEIGSWGLEQRLDRIEALLIRIADEVAPIESKPMPERLDRVSIAMTRGDIQISWEARDALIRELDQMPSAARIVADFRNAGATRPIELTVEERGLLYSLLDEWGRRAGGFDNLHPDIRSLRDVLAYE